MTGAWVAYEDFEGWGGQDMLFATEEAARAYVAARNAETKEWEHSHRYVAFVPWGECALAVESEPSTGQ